MYRIGRVPENNDEDYRQILIEFSDVDAKHKVLKNNTKLKDWDDKDESIGTKDVYINMDETPLTRKENARLRKERNRLRELDGNQRKRTKPREIN